MAKKLGRDGHCRFIGDDPKEVGVRCRVEGVEIDLGVCSENGVRVIHDDKRYLIVIDGGAVRLVSGSELKV